jgi:lipopolysaccharide export LptBFGC system permease protein LptF
MVAIDKQRGISLVSLILGLAILGFVGLIAAQVFPTYTEFRSVKAAAEKAKTAGSTPAEIKASFDKSAEVNYITSIKGSDLIITREESGMEVSFAYDKKVHLFGPASLLLEYQGTTSKNGMPETAPAQ